MTSQQYMIALAAIVFLGIAAQWLAWLRLPAILLLLPCRPFRRSVVRCGHHCALAARGRVTAL